MAAQHNIPRWDLMIACIGFLGGTHCGLRLGYASPPRHMKQPFPKCRAEGAPSAPTESGTIGLKQFMAGHPQTDSLSRAIHLKQPLFRHIRNGLAPILRSFGNGSTTLQEREARHNRNEWSIFRERVSSATRVFMPVSQAIHSP